MRALKPCAVNMCAVKVPISLFQPICEMAGKNLVRGGGVENILHRNNLSENTLQVKGNCTLISRPKEVGGYMKRADWSRVEKSYSVFRHLIMKERTLGTFN